jgi:Asp-tRNA(Asn)/Glu-tRNA(Gln) amidotransferase A subunit family amidase
MSKPIKLTDELIYTSAPELAAAIRAKHVSSEAVVNAYLRHIEAVNPRLNAAGSSPMIHAFGRERQASERRQKRWR